MSIEKVANQSSVLKSFEIEINGNQVLQDEIVSLEIIQSFFNFGLKGSLKIKDSFNFLNNFNNKKNNSLNEIVVYCEDILGEKSSRTYVIETTKFEEYNERFNLISFTFIDKVTFLLKNTYLSKGFNSSPVDSLISYFDYCGVADVLDQDNLVITKKNLEAVSDYNFCVPQNISVLSFFVSFFNNFNISFYQTRNGICFNVIDLSKIYDEQDFKLSDQTEEIIFTNDTLNNDYLFKFHDFTSLIDNKLSVNDGYPYTKTHLLNENKKNQSNSLNINNYKNILSMNDATYNVQDTIGERLDSFYNFNLNYDDIAKNNMFKNFLRYDTIEIVVAGNLYVSNVSNVIELEFKGNTLTQSSILEGNEYLSGKYFITKVSDRFIGNKIIQKLTINKLF